MEYVLQPAKITSLSPIVCKSCGMNMYELNLSDIVIRSPYMGEVQMGFRCSGCRTENVMNITPQQVPQPVTYGSGNTYPAYKSCSCGQYMTYTKGNVDCGYKVACSKCGADWII